MATSKFTQAALRALDHTVETNPGCVCSIDFKKSGTYSYSKLINLPTRIHKITIKVIHSTEYNTTEHEVVYEVQKIYQRWWFRIVKEEDEFVEVEG